MLGDYGMKINVKNLCVGKKDGFALNNLHLKRFVYSEEPDADTYKFDGNFIKDLTGSDEASFRKIYSMDSTITIHALLMICCNKKPPINSFDSATKKRTIDYPFLSTFTDDDVNNVDRFKGDTKFDENKFRIENRMWLFHLLMDYLRPFLESGKKINLSQNLKDRVENYLLNSDDFYGWFWETYEKSPNPRNYISMRSAYKTFKTSSYFNNLPKNKKSKYSAKIENFEEEIDARKNIKALRRKRYQPTIDGKRKNLKNVLVGIQETPKFEETSTTEEFEEDDNGNEQ